MSKTNMKALIEQRNAQQKAMEDIVGKAQLEERAMSQEEVAAFDAAEEELRALDETLAREERIRQTETRTEPGDDQTAVEERAFADYVLGRVQELRSGEQNVTMGNNGAIIPTSIASRIIKEVKDRCPIFAQATIYHVQGTLKIPVWGDASDHNIAVGYQTEFTEITADSGKFTSVDLGGYLAGALTLVGKSVENNAAFDVVSFIVSQMAEAIAIWIEGQLLVGTGSSAAQGACETTNVLTAAAIAAVTADELITLQAQVKKVYQKNACWTMHPDTYTAIKKLKDTTGQYLFQQDPTREFGYILLGKPVNLSDNMPTMAASAKTILYGDYKGLSVNMRESISVQVLREKYATQHALGVVSWFEFDSKVSNNQMLAVLTQKAST